ncbi:MAG TPA: ankyrin repeat domain-containing protein [Spirochaetota bacterium]|nr:ankyrin repeat domain-containing protein [Spirochaetota bacterium]
MKKTGIILIAAAFFFSVSLVSASATEEKLISAAKSGNVQVIQELLSQGLSADTSDSSGRTLLLLAGANGRYAAAEFLINKGASVKASDSRGNTLLHILAASSKKDAVSLMEKALNRGADINALNFSSPGQTPAEIAVSRGNIPALELLMARGVGSDYYLGNKPMIVFAYEARQIKVMKFIAEKGADIDKENINKDTLLHSAVLKNDLATVKYLIEKKASIDRKGSQGRTALFMAVEKGYLKIAGFLIQNGSTADTTDYSGKNIMHLLAAGKNNGKTITEFSSCGININKIESGGLTPLMTAVKNKRWENVTALIDAGADFKFTGSTDKTLLVTAIENKNSNLASYLIGKGIDVKKKDTSGRTALHAAASLKGKEWDKLTVQIILSGGNANEADSSGVTPAGIAVDTGNISGFITLLDNGLNINLMERGTDPIVLYAYKKNLKSAFTGLVKRGADISLKDGDGNSMLHLAAEKDDRAFYNTLVPMNPDLNIKNAAGKTPLFLSVEKGNLQFAKMLLDQKDKINLKIKDGQGMSVFHYLASAKGGAAILSMIEVDQHMVSEEDAAGRTPLAIAVHANLTDNADFYLKHGADPKGNDWQGSKLVITAYEKSKAMMNLLLLNGADPGAVNPDGKTLFYLSIEKNDIATLKLLAARKDYINKKYMGGISPLNHAIDKGRTEIIQFLISSGAELNARDDSGTTPLTAAVNKTDYKTVSLLLNGGADSNVKKTDGKSVLLISYEKNRSNIFDILLAAGASSSEKFENGNTLLHMSALGNRLGFINSLVKNKADLNTLNNESKTAIMLASEKGYSNSVKALIAGGADVKIKDKDGESALYKCIKTGGEGGYWCADYLVKGGAEINDRTGSGTPLLHEAAALEKYSIVTLLLKNGGDPNILNPKNETLIMVLSKTQFSGAKDKPKSTQAAKLILDLTSKGSDPNIPDKYGRSPLDISCRIKNMIIVEALLKGGANVNGTDAGGNTALKKTAMDYIGDYKISGKEKKSAVELIDFLIKNGADINAKDKFGRTALSHILKEANQKNFRKVADLVPVLTARGASVDIKDNDGKNASDYAVESGISEIKELVR